jgi:hypothetical protein
MNPEGRKANLLKESFVVLKRQGFTGCEGTPSAKVL